MAARHQEIQRRRISASLAFYLRKGKVTTKTMVRNLERVERVESVSHHPMCHHQVCSNDVQFFGLDYRLVVGQETSLEVASKLRLAVRTSHI